MEIDSTLVISGVSGRYPESENLDHFWSNLLNGIEMCTLDDRHFAPKLHKDSFRIGKLLDVESFDDDFFKFPDKVTKNMGATCRVVLEVIYEAIYDSGNLSSDWKNKKTGLFIGRSDDEEEMKFVLPYICSVLDIHCGSVQVDTACASTASALDIAMQSIELGQCDQAIVVGCNTLYYHSSSIYFSLLNMISSDGASKCLDADADGYCRSESIVAMTVQRKSDAKRVHAKILGLKTNCDGYKTEGITFPKLETQSKLFESSLEGLSIDPLKIKYIEAHVTGTKAGDPIECAAIKKAYRSNSSEPLYLGCLKSNIGHGEGTAFINAISKVVKIFQTGLIPANNNYSKPNPRIEGLINGILVPVLENKSFYGDVIPVHALGFGGVNAVAVLEANDKKAKEEDKVMNDFGLPRLVHFCNRTLNGLESMVSFVNEQKGQLTKYTLSLINDLSKDKPSFGFNYRGYLLLDRDQSIIHNEFSEVNQVLKPWFIFTPIFDASYEMFMAFPVIRRRLEDLNSKILESKGINIIEMINNNQKDFVSQLVSSTAIQMVLYDFISKDFNIVPQGIIGHSLGSIAAAYADNCLTDELAISIAYQIATVCESEFNHQHGLMVNINLPWKEIEVIKGEGVDIASHESRDWTIISGSKESVESFITKLDNRIEHKTLNTNNIPFHSSLLGKVSDLLRKALIKLNLQPKYASDLSVFTTVYSQKKSKFLINENFFGNLLRFPCYLHEVCHNLSPKSVAIVVSDTINCYDNLKSSFVNSNCNKNSANTFLHSIGKLYLNGLNPAIENLYERVNYPVPRETQSLGHLIKWNHNKKWCLPEYSEYSHQKLAITKEIVDLNEPDYSFISGHVIDGRTLFPGTGFLHIAWLKLCKKHFSSISESSPIEFYRVRLHRAIYFVATMKVEIRLKVNVDTMSFIMYTENESNICVSGHYRFVNEPSISLNMAIQDDLLPTDQDLIMNSKDIYKELRVRGYDYSGAFRGFTQASSKGNWGLIKDTTHWISFADSCLQVLLLSKKTRELVIPTAFDYVYMDPSVTQAAYNQIDDSEPKLKVLHDKTTGTINAPGFILKGFTGDGLKRRLEVPGNRREYQLFEPFECNIQLTQELDSIRDTYSEQCLKCIEILKGNKILGELYLDDHEIADLISTNNVSNTLLAILYAAVGKYQVDPVKNLRLEYQQKCNNLLEDLLFLDPLDYLIQRSVAGIFENFIFDKVNAAALNFLQIPSEVSLDNEELFSRLNMKVKYINNYANMVNQSDLEFSKLDLMKDDKINGSQSPFDLIFVRDASTYLPKTSFKSPESVSNCDTKALMKVVFNSLNSGGFCIMITRTKLTLVEQEFYHLLGHNHAISFDQSAFRAIVEEIGFTWIGFKHLEPQGYCSILLRRPFPVNTEQELSIIRITLDYLNWIDEIKKASQNKNHKIWLIGGGHDNGIIGLTKCLNRDPYGYNVRCYYDPSKSDNEEIKIPDDVLAKDYLINYVENGSVGSFIHQNIDNCDETEVETRHCYADVRTKGDLSSARWFQSEHSSWKEIPKSKLKMDVELITIYYGALNFKDIMVSTNRVPLRAYPYGEMVKYKPSIGMEFSGIDSNGNRIMGICESGGISSSLLIDQSCTKMLIPVEWTLAQAATVPVVYLTVYYGLFSRGDLRSGETVLIHAGSGGIGQAAISICLARNCEVFTTVGTQAKRDFIKQRFPKIDDAHIGDSRSTSFEEMILRKTNGRGVDLILNSLSDDKLTASLRCLADFGRFIEIGKYDLVQNTLMDNIEMDDNKAFHACCLAHLREEVLVEKNPDRINLWNNLIELLNEGIKSGEVKPLSTTIFKMNQLEESFRYMATGKHIGKVLIQMRDEQDTRPKLYKAIGQTFFDLNKVYIITGGLGGIGLELAYWMSLRGATNLILTSRNGIKDSYQQYMIDRILDSDYTHTKVLISNEDCHTCESTQRLINMADEKGSIGGIFHLAMVLKDAFFEDQTVDSFLKCVNPKAIACRYLDKLSRQLPYHLDYFVCFSSVSTTIGNIGQSNYCFANSSLEQVCSKRRSDGLHGMAIQLGIIGDVGAVADYTQNVNSNFYNFDVMRLPILLHTFDKLLLTPFPNCLSVIHTEKSMSISSKGASLKQSILHVLGLTDANKVDSDATLVDLGLDSLMTIEIRQGLETKYNYSLSTQEIRSLKISHLAELEEKLQKIESVDKNGSEYKLDSTNFDQIIIPSEIFTPLNERNLGLPVFYFPQISGSFTDISHVFDHVHSSVIGVSWVEYMKELESMDQVANFYVDALIANFHPKVKYFDLAGYSYGGIIAFQVACKLQERMGLNCVRNLILLDVPFDSVLKTAQHLRTRLQVADENVAHALLLVEFISIYYPLLLSDSIEAHLISMKTKHERYDFIRSLFSAHNISSQTFEVIDLYCSKMKVLAFTEVDKKFQGEVILFRARNKKILKYSPKIEILDLEDYGLSKYTTGKVKVHLFEGDHETFIRIEAKRIAAYIESLTTEISV